MNNITLRPYTDGDYDMLCEWRKAHGTFAMPAVMLPKCGVVCERDGVPVASLFLHMSNSNGMCMAEHAASAPGLSFRAAREAFGHCVECLKTIASDLGYHTMAVFTHPSISRTLKKHGFIESEKNLVQMFAPTKEIPNG